ncbi:MAG: hypothetical protein CMP33_07640 [Rickettsiales bacterium]|nr:hypothetical protein [Rickettsiales bacterium]|tara:strand:- start:193 stop:573 length:381 start_codon:yes stop_codon:yes gene_type:complete
MKDFINKVKDKFKKVPKEETSEQKRLRLLEEEKKAATKAKKPWVAVLNTHVNHHDIKNGFFELDWNNEFIEQLLDAGYKGETNEQIVDAWFKTIARNILEEQGLDPNRDSGYIKINKRDDGKSEVS